MWITVFSLLTLAFCLLTVHPFVTYPLSLWMAERLGARRPLSPGVEDETSRFAIVFCAYNEESVLPAKLNNLRSIQESFGSDRVQIYAFDDCSADRTYEILQEAPFVNAFHGEARGGKSVGMNRLLDAVDADYVVFTDANVLFDKGVLPAFARVLRDPTVGVACGNLTYDNSDTPTASVGTSYWRLEETIKELESQTGSVMGADGSIFAIRRKLFRPIPPDIIDDFFTSMSILCDKYRIVRCADAMAFERSADNSGDEFRRKVRIACRVFNCHRLLSPRLKQLSWWDRYKYVSHRLVRWFVAVWVAGAALSAIATVGAAFGFGAGALAAGAVAATFFVIRLLRWTRLPLLSKLWDAWLAFLGTAVGVARSIRGDRFQTWEPVKSARQSTAPAG